MLSLLKGSGYDLLDTLALLSPRAQERDRWWGVFCFNIVQ